VRRLRRTATVVFAGDARVWRAVTLAAVPLVALLVYYCLRPREYYTGTNNVEAVTYIAQTPAGAPMCIPGLEIPAETGRIRLQMVSLTPLRPAMTLTLTLPGGRTVHSRLASAEVPGDRVSGPEFPVPRFPSRPAQTPASLCIRAGDVVNWAGTPLPVPPPGGPTLAGVPLNARVAVWYLPPAGRQKSYLSRLGQVMSRAALFRPGLIGPWLYYLIVFAVLPALALLSVRCLAVASAGGAGLRWRRMAALLYGIAAVNFICWSLITPAFQAPDEVDHFAYTQSLVERGEAPSRDPGSPLPRWSSAQYLAMEDMNFLTDHQVGDTRIPWSSNQEARYRAQAAGHPSSSDGGGNETAATHGAIYYSVLAPAYLLASSSPLDQLTLMRLASALIGALTVLFAFLLARELAPGRLWLAVLAALLVAYHPMYGFVSGSVNNDVGVNAGAAGLELLLIMILRRGFTVVLALLAGVLLLVLPIVKATAEELYPVAGIAALFALWRHHSRRDLAGIGVLAAAAVAARAVAHGLGGVFRPTTVTGTAAAPAVIAGGAIASGVVSTVVHDPFGYLGYLWQVFLPRLPFMARHFETASPPGFIIYVERGWGAFGWYDIFFPHWVYLAIFAAMCLIAVMAVVAAVREWSFVRRHLPEALVLLLIPLAVVGGVEAAYYTPGLRVPLAEFGRYAFPAIAALAVLVVAALQALGRRWAPVGGAVLLVAMLALSYAAQLVTLTGFYA
jgi:hypothetical protein